MKLGPKVFPKLFPKQTDTHTPCQTRQQVFLTTEGDTTVARDTVNVQNNRTGPETASDDTEAASYDGRQRPKTGNDVRRQKTKSDDGKQGPTTESSVRRQESATKQTENSHVDSTYDERLNTSTSRQRMTPERAKIAGTTPRHPGPDSGLRGGLKN